MLKILGRPRGSLLTKAPAPRPAPKSRTEDTKLEEVEKVVMICFLNDILYRSSQNPSLCLRKNPKNLKSVGDHVRWSLWIVLYLYFVLNELFRWNSCKDEIGAENTCAVTMHRIPMICIS